MKSLFDYSDKEQKEIIDKAAKESNEAQKEYMTKTLQVNKDVRTHHIGPHRAVVVVVCKGKKVYSVCCECGKRVKEL